MAPLWPVLPRRGGNWIPLALLLAFLSSWPARGQQEASPPRPAQPPAAQAPAPRAPSIRVTTRLVQIGVTVHDKNGAVPRLTQADFAVFDQGKPRTISVFSETAAAAAGAAAAPPEVLPRNVFSDLPRYEIAAPRSITIVLLDKINTLYGSAPGSYEDTPLWVEDHALAYARAQTIQYIKNLDPRDRVAIYALGDSLDVLCDFTSDRSQLLAILEKGDARSRTSRETAEPKPFHSPVPGKAFNETVDRERQEQAGIANGDRAVATMTALKAIADHVANIPGRKNLVWLTANLPFSATELARILGPAGIAAYPVDGRGLQARSMVKSMRDGIDADAIARGDIGLESSTEPSGLGTMRQLAEMTGGVAFVNRNDLSNSIRTAVEDSTGLYVLGFYIDEASADGKFHDLKVQLKLSGFRVRYPKGYFAYRDEPATQTELRNNWLTAVHSPIESSAIPFLAEIARGNEPAPDTLTVFGAIDPRALRLKERNSLREGAVDVSLVEQDLTGKTLWESNYHLTIQMTPQEYTGALKTGVRFQKHLAPQEGATMLRILVQDSNTALVGSMIIPLSQIQ